MTALVDQWGNPLRKAVLTREVAGPTLAGVRQPIAGYPADGLNPVRLANILREADQGEPLSYFELAEQIEERDLHYVGVLGTRKRAVSQLDITVEPASDSAEDQRRAGMVSDWLNRDELADEMFDILDAIGKGISWTEIIWEHSEGQYRPQRLEWRDPRFFRYDRDGATPMLRGGEDGHGQDSPLPAFKFIQLQIKAKSGLAIRSGLARLAAWSWMFKAYTQRDWAIFTQTYGQPIRVGKYHAGASQDDRDTLYRAVANIAGDCAAIIPEGMNIDFVEADNISAGADLYEKRADWLDRQVSKAVLGQTNTTDAQAGGLGSGQANAHNDVREDIEKADGKAAAAVLNRDLVRAWCDLEFGPGSAYPKVTIARPEQEDLKLLSESLKEMVPLGLRVSATEIRGKFGLNDPGEQDEILTAPTSAPTAFDPARTSADPSALTLHARQSPKHPAEVIALQLADKGDAHVREMAGTIETMLERAGDLHEFRAMLAGAFGDIDSTALAEVIAGGLAAAHAAGRSDVTDESA
ncbi:MAG: DUF935 domain-containing protein [Erythrobacter sp.]|nr:DUF935 domain-containing protein [Erythrobacter sp.]